MTLPLVVTAGAVVGAEAGAVVAAGFGAAVGAGAVVGAAAGALVAAAGGAGGELHAANKPLVAPVATNNPPSLSSRRRLTFVPEAMCVGHPFVRVLETVPGIGGPCLGAMCPKVRSRPADA
jgi:hypothetical protein